jgi:hypothetical protein
MAFRLRRGTDAERLLITPEEGELIYTTDTKKIYVGDGTTLGGNIVNTEIELEDVGGVDLSTPPSAGQSLQYDGANWVAGDITGILEGSTFRIDVNGDILGDDSSVLLNATTSLLTVDTVSANAITGATITGNLIGNGSAITDMETTNLEDWSKSTPNAGETVFWNAVDGVWQPTNFLTINGNFTGTLAGSLDGDVTGSIFGDDSTVIIDGQQKSLLVDVRSSADNSIIIDSAVKESVFAKSTIKKGTAESVLDMVYGDDATDLSAYSGKISDIRFATEGTDGRKSYDIITAYTNGLVIAHNDDGTSFPLETLNVINKDGVALGGINPAARLDVRGDAIVSGFTQFGSLTSVERDALTAANGMVIYNTTNNKFEGYQNGAWINLDDGLAAS